MNNSKMIERCAFLFGGGEEGGDRRRSNFAVRGRGPKHPAGSAPKKSREES